MKKEKRWTVEKGVLLGLVCVCVCVFYKDTEHKARKINVSTTEGEQEGRRLANLNGHTDKTQRREEERRTRYVHWIP